MKLQPEITQPNSNKEIGALPYLLKPPQRFAHDPGMDLQIACQLILFHPLSTEQAIQDDYTQSNDGHLQVNMVRLPIYEG